MKLLLIIGLGGGAGSILRYLMQVAVNRLIPALAFPLGTFAVNITGCFLIGLFYGLSVKHAWFTDEWRLLLITGLCGGYTTFSSFSYESMGLITEGHFLYFGLYAGLSVLLGLCATWLGYMLLR